MRFCAKSDKINNFLAKQEFKMEPTDNHYVHRFNEAINREARSNLYNKLCNFNENVRLGPALKPSGEASGLPLTPEESRWLVGVYLLYSLMDKGNVEEMPRYISLEAELSTGVSKTPVA